MLGPLCLLAVLASAPADLQALGVVVSQQPGKSVAILRAGGRTRVATVGDEAFGGRVTAIAAGLVTLDFEGARVDLRLRPPAPTTAAAVPQPAAAAPAPPPPREVAAAPQTME